MDEWKDGLVVYMCVCVIDLYLSKEWRDRDGWVDEWKDGLVVYVFVCVCVLLIYT